MFPSVEKAFAPMIFKAAGLKKRHSELSRCYNLLIIDR